MQMIEGRQDVQRAIKALIAEYALLPRDLGPFAGDPAILYLSFKKRFKVCHVLDRQHLLSNRLFVDIQAFNSAVLSNNYEFNASEKLPMFLGVPSQAHCFFNCVRSLAFRFSLLVTCSVRRGFLFVGA